MKSITTFVLGLFLVFQPILGMAQAAGASGRTTGGIQSHGSVGFSTGGLSLSCSDAGCTSDSSGTISPGSQVVSGTIHFTSTTDANGTIGGSTGGGAGQAQVSCDGGSTWNTFAAGSATLPTTSMSFTYPTPACTGPTNLNTLLFKVILGGGGASGFNMHIQAPSSVTISW